MATQFIDDEWEYSEAPVAKAPVAKAPPVASTNNDEDEWEYSAPTQEAVTTSATNPYGKMGRDEEAQFSPDPLRITPLRLPKPVEDEYYGMLAQNKGREDFSQKNIDDFWTTRGYAPQAADDTFIDAVRKGEDTGKIDYSSWDKAQQDLEDDRMKRAMEDFSKEAFEGDYASAVDEGVQYGFWGITSRTLKDVFDTNKDAIREQFPEASDEELERLSDQDVIRRARAARNYYHEANKDSGWVPWLAGQATASLDPTIFIAPGASVGGRIAGQAGAQMLTQGAFEGIDAAQGLPSGQAGENILLAGALGTGLQGLVEIGGKVFRRVRGAKGETLEEVVNPTPEEIAGARLQDEADAFQARKAQEEPSALEQEAQTFQGSKDPTVEDVFPTPEQTAAKEAAIAEKLAGEVEAFKARGEEPEVAPEAAPAPPKVTVDRARESVDYLTEDWTNAPEIEIVQSARDLGDDSIDPDALGFIGEDGKVRIIADNLNGPEDVRAVIFHEALGHHGLSQKFGEELDDIFMRAYDSGGKFKQDVDDFITSRPDYVEAYADSINPTARLIEEIFAGKSESGIVLPPNVLAKMKVYLKDLARKMGITKWTEMTDKDIQTILGMAHDATINGKPNAVQNGFKYAKAYHGSAADFDQFDHSKMGTGEGAQVFGWGTYLSDSEGIARSYRDKLSNVKRTWGGMEQDSYTVRRNAQDYAEQKYGDTGSEVSDQILAYMDSNANRKPKNAKELFNWYMDDPSWGKDRNSWDRVNETYRKEFTEIYDDLNSKIGATASGKLYEVEIPDDGVWIDWNFQPTDEVKKAFEDLGIKALEMTPDEVSQIQTARQNLTRELADIDEKASLLNKQRKALIDEVKPITDQETRLPLLVKIRQLGDEWIANDKLGTQINNELRNIERDLKEAFPTGEDLYAFLAQKMGPEGASKALAAKGITGNKYAANSLSGSPDFSKFNYVVFDDKTPKIAKKYMKPDKARSDSRFKREDTLLRRENARKNEKSYEDWKRNWDFDEFSNELEATPEYMERLAAGEPRYMKKPSAANNNRLQAPKPPEAKASDTDWAKHYLASEKYHLTKAREAEADGNTRRAEDYRHRAKLDRKSASGRDSELAGEMSATDRAIYFREEAEYYNAKMEQRAARGDAKGVERYRMFRDDASKKASELAQVSLKYMKRQAGKGSEGSLQGSATREVKERGDLNTPISKFRSNRDLTDITEEIMPERTKETWDEWIDEAGSIKMSAKAAENLATGVDVPHLKAAETLLLRTKNRIFDLSRKASNQTLSPKEADSLRVEVERARNIAQSIQDVVSNAARILNSRNIEVSDDRATGAMIRNMLRQIDEGKLNDPVEVQKMANALRRGDKKDKAIATSLDILTEVLNLPRSIMSSMDLSAPLRQGVFFVGNKRWWGALIPMIKQFAKEKNYDFFLNDIKNRPTFTAMMKSGLALTSKEGKNLSQREEAFLGTWAEKIPLLGRGVKASNRAYVGFLNKLRADVFDDLVKKYHAAGIDVTGKGNEKALKDIAKFVNAATGRGSLGNFSQAAAELSNAFFSPRLLSSRVTMLNPNTYVKLDPIVRKEAIKSLVSFGAIATTVASLAAMMFPDDVTVELDPRSSDFAKIKAGNTRYDILGGFGQYLTLGARVTTNSKKTAKGEVKELGEGYGSDNALDVIARFFGNKEAPLASLLTDYLRGENAVGEEFSWDTALLSRMVPMMWQDMAELVSDRGAMGIPMALPSVFGVGSQTYHIDLGFDAFGRDIEETQKSKEPESDPVVLEVSALGERTGEIPLSKGPKSFKFEGKKYELDDEQAAEWQQIMGDLQHQFLSEDITSEEWLAGDDNDKLKITKKAHQDAFAQTKEYFLTQKFGIPPIDQEEEEVDDDFIYE